MAAVASSSEAGAAPAPQADGKLYVGNLPWHVDSDMLGETFQQFGAVQQCDVRESAGEGGGAERGAEHGPCLPPIPAFRCSGLPLSAPRTRGPRQGLAAGAVDVRARRAPHAFIPRGAACSATSGARS